MEAILSEAQFPLDPKVISEQIGTPLDLWHGNCHAVASLILEKMPIMGMRLVRGHYDGHVSKDSVYHGGIQQHSWLRLEDGRILDPTRWCMTRPENPFIYLGENDAYDEAGVMLSEMSRAAWSGSLAAIGALRPEDRLQGLLDDMTESQKMSLADGLQIPAEKLSGFELLQALSAPVEHLEDPASFYRAAEECSLKSMIKMDNWMRVMDPEKVTPKQGTNFFYTAPPREDMTDAQILFKTFSRFLSIEHRGEKIHRELEELGYTLEDLWDDLNDLERALRIDPGLEWARPSRELLCFAAMDLLGKGFGEELRVERFVDSLGMDRKGFDSALREFAKPAGLDVTWIWPPRPEDEPCEEGLSL